MDMRHFSLQRQFGNLLRSFRVRAGLTQGELADLAHLSVHSISNYERGAPHLPYISTTRLLANALNLSPAEQADFIATAQWQSQRLPAVTAPFGDASPYTVPLPLTSLIGREQELRQAETLLRAGDLRLLTIVGPPGVGKTRLALALALDLACGGAAAPYEDTFLVSLAPLRDPTHVLSAIAEALRLSEAPNRSVSETIARFLQGKRTLLLLDNFEHVVASAYVLAELLAHCPTLTALVTSRAPLRLRGEQLFDLAPLALPPVALPPVALPPVALPPVALPPHTTPAPRAQVTQTPAITLLLERVQAIDPAFALTPANTPTIVAICRQLDGLPLALELAAARFGHMRPEALLGRLERRMETLTTSAPDLPAHQQTLRATLDWSYTLLPPAAQEAFRWLSICVGGCVIEGAEDLCVRIGQLTGSHASSDGALDRVTALLDHHLLLRAIREEDGAVGGEGDDRLTMLATIQEYASERLCADPDEQRAAARAHAYLFLELVETAAPALHGPGQVRWITRLRHEQDNLRAALRWSLRQQDGQLALRFTAALWWYWNTVGMLSEGRDWLEQALTLAPPVESLDTAGQRTLAEAYNGAGVLATRQGDFAAAERFHAQALPLRRALGDPVGLASSLNSLGGLLMQQGRLHEAQSAWEESLSYRRQSGDGRAVALGLMNLGVLALNRGELRAAVSYVEESVPLFRTAGDVSMLSNALINLALASLLAGELAAAQQHITEGLQIARARELRRLIGLGLIVESELAHAHGDLDGAEAVAQKGLAIWREMGSQTNVATMLALLGTLRYERGDLSASETLLRESLALVEQLADPSGLADVWTRLGHLARVRGRAEHAVAAYQQSLRVSMGMESLAGTPDALEGLATVQGSGEAAKAHELFALAQAIRASTGAARAPYHDVWAAPLWESLQAALGAEAGGTWQSTMTPRSVEQLHCAIAALALEERPGASSTRGQWRR
jgi:predicted ATPase/DNA-binding XRE family transcriptional regulator